MTDLNPIFNTLLSSHNAPSTTSTSLSMQHIDEFLKEAYRINSAISKLTTYLTSIRKSYLSTAPPPRRLHTSKSTSSQTQYLTSRQRDEIDAATKSLLRELNSHIRNLADTEQIRQNTETALLQKKYSRLGLGMLGAWANGGSGIGGGKSYEETVEEEKLRTVRVHREGVLWYLRERLGSAVGVQAGMMGVRIAREVEREKGVLYKSRGSGNNRMSVNDFGGFEAPQHDVGMEREVVENVTEGMSAEQVQMLEEENQDMLRHYEGTLDQVKTAEKSLVEIAELQTQLVENLATQSAQIDMLVQDSVSTSENVGDGNKELKKATERRSVAKYVFYASCGLSFTLVVWDLLI